MAKNKPTHESQQPAGAQICVVYGGSVNGVDTGDQWPHEGPAVVSSRDYKLDPLTLEAGASLVDAALYQAHLDANSPGLEHLVLCGSVTTYATAEEALASIPASQLRRVLGVTRHGALLRQWEAIESQAARPRAVILDDIRGRLRLYRDHAPEQFLSLGGLRKTKNSPRQHEARP